MRSARDTAGDEVVDQDSDISFVAPRAPGMLVPDESAALMPARIPCAAASS